MPTALIIGASRGLGRALAEEFLARRWHVLVTVRDGQSLADMPPRHEENLEVFDLEITDRKATFALAEILRGRSLDLLFVSAGIFGPVDLSFKDLGQDKFDEIMLVNVLAPLRIIDTLIDFVPNDGTVAVMSSGVASSAQNAGGNFEPYRMSKGALNLGFRSIAARYEDSGRTFLAVAPGWVKTDMGGEDAPLTPQQSARGIADAILARRGAGGVGFVDYENNAIPW